MREHYVGRLTGSFLKAGLLAMAIFIQGCIPLRPENLLMTANEAVIFGRIQFRCTSTGLNSSLTCAGFEKASPYFLSKSGPAKMRVDKQGYFVGKVPADTYYLLRINWGNQYLHLPAGVLQIGPLNAGSLYYVGSAVVGYGRSKEEVLSKYPEGKVITNGNGRWSLITQVKDKSDRDLPILDSLFPNHSEVEMLPFINRGMDPDSVDRR